MRLRQLDILLARLLRALGVGLHPPLKGDCDSLFARSMASCSVQIQPPLKGNCDSLIPRLSAWPDGVRHVGKACAAEAIATSRAGCSCRNWIEASPRRCAAERRSRPAVFWFADGPPDERVRTHAGRRRQLRQSHRSAQHPRQDSGAAIDDVSWSVTPICRRLRRSGTPSSGRDKRTPETARV